MSDPVHEAELLRTLAARRDKVLDAYLRGFRGRGGTLETRAEVTRLRRQQHSWELSAGEDRYGASVVVKGAATEVTDWAEKELLEDLGIVPWSDGEWRQSWIRIAPSEITGRQIN
jgi:L-2-hydroxyglutarate oxidase LhgO